MLSLPLLLWALRRSVVSNQYWGRERGCYTNCQHMRVLHREEYDVHGFILLPLGSTWDDFYMFTHMLFYALLIPRLRRSTASWAALGRLLPADQGKWSFLSAQATRDTPGLGPALGSLGQERQGHTEESTGLKKWGLQYQASPHLLTPHACTPLPCILCLCFPRPFAVTPDQHHSVIHHYVRVVHISLYTE